MTGKPTIAADHRRRGAVLNGQAWAWALAIVWATVGCTANAINPASAETTEHAAKRRPKIGGSVARRVTRSISLEDEEEFIGIIRKLQEGHRAPGLRRLEELLSAKVARQAAERDGAGYDVLTIRPKGTSTEGWSKLQRELASNQPLRFSLAPDNTPLPSVHFHDGKPIFHISALRSAALGASWRLSAQLKGLNPGLMENRLFPSRTPYSGNAFADQMDVAPMNMADRDWVDADTLAGAVDLHDTRVAVDMLGIDPESLPKSINFPFAGHNEWLKAADLVDADGALQRIQQEIRQLDQMLREGGDQAEILARTQILRDNTSLTPIPPRGKIDVATAQIVEARLATQHMRAILGDEEVLVTGTRVDEFAQAGQPSNRVQVSSDDQTFSVYFKDGEAPQPDPGGAFTGENRDAVLGAVGGLLEEASENLDTLFNQLRTTLDNWPS